jgi:hypothetical protein
MGGYMIPWYQSKIVWAMVVQSLISVLLLVQEWYSKADYSVPGIIGLVIGVLVIVLRIWFTESPVDTAKARGKFDDQYRRFVG